MIGIVLVSIVVISCAFGVLLYIGFICCSRPMSCSNNEKR